MAKMDPQKRAYGTLVALVESRQRGKSRAEADDWMARGWNPLARQEGASWREVGGFELMASDGGWGDWFGAHRARWPELAAAAFKPGPDGKLDAGPLAGIAARISDSDDSEWRSAERPDLLGVLLACGISPNGRSREGSRGEGGLPAVFLASRAGAERLIQAGADMSAKGSKGESCWEHWARRCMAGRGVSVEDLDWMARRCPPSWSGSASIGVDAIAHRDVSVAKRLAEAGAPAQAFGLGDHGRSAETLRQIMRGADSHAMVEILGSVRGWPKMLEDWMDDSEGSAPIRLALFSGRAKTLGVLERAGLFKSGAATPEGLAELGAQCWSEMKAAVQSRRCPAWAPYSSATPEPAGMVWALGRVPAKSASVAAKALAACVAAYPVASPRLAKACASKGYLPDSGPGSLRDLYKDGALWEEAALPALEAMEFSEFTALCEDRAFKRDFKPKPKQAAAPRRARL